MQMRKTLGILLAVCFLMSVTAAAVSARSDDQNNRMMIKTKAVDDSFKLNSKYNKGDVLKNDKGRDLKIVWMSKPKNGKVSMKSDGKFTYKPDRSREKTLRDSFKYAIKGKDRKTSIATVKITFENKDRDDHGGPR